MDVETGKHYKDATVDNFDFKDTYVYITNKCEFSTICYRTIKDNNISFEAILPAGAFRDILDEHYFNQQTLQGNNR